VDDDPGSLVLSELESITVIGVDHEEIGELTDVIALFSPESPVITAVFIERDDEQLLARWDQIVEIDIDEERLVLCAAAADLEAASLRGDEIALVDSVLDHQVLDVSRRKFVRVQDVVLEPRDGELVVTGIDASSGAIARRIGLGFLSRRLPRRAGDFVPWHDVNLISVRLSRLNFIEAFAELAELHPADLADVVGQVGPRERAAARSLRCRRRAPPPCSPRSTPTRPPTCSPRWTTTSSNGCSVWYPPMSPRHCAALPATRSTRRVR
jgi:magnesium transporter